jgi:hypothetical protein
MAFRLGKPKMPASKPRKDEERETRQAIVEDADKTEGKNRDLVHGDGGTLGLGRPEDLSQGRLSLFRQQGAVEGRQHSGRYTRRSRPSVARSP